VTEQREVIVKVQRPMAGADKHNIFIYAKGHQGMIERPATQSEQELLGRDFKIFCYAVPTEKAKGRWKLIRRAPDQDW
jgi:hypothetical protein